MCQFFNVMFMMKSSKRCINQEQEALPSLYLYMTKIMFIIFISVRFPIHVISAISRWFIAIM
jgi:hypothetical protein